jgi:hypothetical protein
MIGKIQEHFNRSAFEHRLRELQPELEKRKNEAIEQSAPEIQQLIEHPVVGESRQFYWVIQLRIRTTHTTSTSFAVSSTIPELMSVTVSEKESSNVGPVHEGKPVVAPAQHPVIVREDSGTVTYSQPIISWSAVYPADIAEHTRKLGGSRAEEIDVLRFANDGREVTPENLFAWAKYNYPRMFADRKLVPNIMNSHEFIGSEDARQRAVKALELKVREETPSGEK